MVLYFLRYVLDRERYPRVSELIDPNASISTKALRFATSLQHHYQLLSIPLQEETFAIIKTPATPIDVEEVLSIFKERTSESKFVFWRLLTYFGVFTVKEIKEIKDAPPIYQLGTPNYVAKLEFLSEIKKKLEESPLQRAASNFAKFVNEEQVVPLFQSFLNHAFQITNWERGGSDVKNPEAAFKTSLLNCLKLITMDNNSLTITNESRLQPIKGQDFGKYIDVLIEPRDTNKPGIIIELKNVAIDNLVEIKAGYFNQKIGKAKERPATSIRKKSCVVFAMKI